MYTIESFSYILSKYCKIDYTLSILLMILMLLFILMFISILGLFLVYIERKICAAFQCRLGPSRVGWNGTLQTIADAIKLLLKERITPNKSDKILHFVAPMFCIMATLMTLIIIPYNPQIQIININIGILYWMALSGLGVIGIVIGGWSSYNKWSLLGAMRAGSQLLSYELSIILSIMVIVIFSGSLDLQEIILSQHSGWWIWRGHIVTIISFIIFLVASIAELNRVPFDLPEGESELTAGFHTEYSGIQFAFFFLSEYINLFIMASIMTTLFFGGWLPFNIYGLDYFNTLMSLIPPSIWFLSKVSIIIFIIMWIRWTFPRLRLDQLLQLEWKFLLPIGLINVLLSSIIVIFNIYFFP